MIIQLHYLHNTLEYFPENLVVIREEQGKSVQKDIMTMEDHYQGIRNVHMRAHYCWSFKGTIPKYFHESIKKELP